MPRLSRHRSAIAVIGEALSAERCLAFGHLLPVNSKKRSPERDFAYCRRTLLFRTVVEDLPAFWAGWWKAEAHLSELDPAPAASITGPRSFIPMSSACSRSSSLCYVRMPSFRSCIILQYSAQRAFCS